MNRTETIKEITEWNAFHCASAADCLSPDSPESAGASMLLHVRDNTLEALENVATEDLDSINDDGTIDQIADGAPSVYTYTKWQEFVDLGAWQEDVSELCDGSDMDQAGSVALYIIAERLAYAIVEAVKSADEDEETDEDGE